MPHSAILLAGGKSSRMGRDKAALPVEGIPLWQRQLGVLRDTAPTEIFISGPADGPYAASGALVVPDASPGHGPLGGMVSVLSRCTTPWLVVLAVDMPRMMGRYLRGLLEEASRRGCGVVPQFDERHWQPLAAVYPRAAAVHAAALLGKGERRMEALVRELEAARLVAAHAVAPEDRALFENWNSPADVPPPAGKNFKQE